MIQVVFRALASMDEADNFWQIQAEKKAKLDEKLETFVDHSPSFPKDLRQIVYLSVSVEYSRRDASDEGNVTNENHALFQARFFRGVRA